MVDRIDGPALVQDERKAFENYMLDREHPVIGWIWTDWFKRGDDPETYANDFVQGAWVMWQARPAQTEQQPSAWADPSDLHRLETGSLTCINVYREKKPCVYEPVFLRAAPISQTAPQVALAARVAELEAELGRQHEAHRKTWRQLEQAQLKLAALKGGRADG